MHPRSPLAVVPRTALPSLQDMIVETVRASAPEHRRVGRVQSWRRKDTLRKALNPVHTAQLLIIEAHANGATLEQQLGWARAFEAYVCALYGVEAPADWRRALVDETRAECEANPVQAEAMVAPSRGVFATLAEKLFHHERKVRDARLAVERELHTPVAHEPARPALVR
jgi:hypothetical protein